MSQEKICLASDNFPSAHSAAVALFADNIWLEFVGKTNYKAQQLAGITQVNLKLKPRYPAETEQIFFNSPENWVAKIQEKNFCMCCDREKSEIHFIPSCNTNDVKAAQEWLSKL